MIELTAEQHDAIAANGTGPVRAIDLLANAEYVLVPAAVYERLKNLLIDDPDWPKSGYAAALEVFAREGWDDPRMDVYDALDPRKQS